jgi:hypothetical protein
VGWAIWSWEIVKSLTEAEILMTEAKSIEELEVGAGSLDREISFWYRK